MNEKQKEAFLKMAEKTMGTAHNELSETAKTMEPVFDIPVVVSAVLGKVNIPIGQLLKMSTGAVLELDKKVGDSIDIYVNDRLIAKGELVAQGDHLGVTLTEILRN